MDINSTLAIVCYVFITLLIVYWLYGILNKYTEIDYLDEVEEKEDDIKNPLV